MANGSTFIADLQAWVARDNARLEAIARQSIMELAYRMRENTGPPVGPNIITGWLVAGWQPSIGTRAPPRQADAEADQFVGRDADAELTIVIANLDIGATYYDTNYVAYGPRQNWGFTGVDALGRHVHQPGRFFVEKTLATWPQIVNEVAVDLNFSP